MCGGGDGGAAESRQMEIDRQNRIKAGIAAVNDAFVGFDNSFYAKQKSNYNAWAMPQLNRQYNQQLDQLKYGLARTGLGSSSAGARAKSDLTFDMNLASQQIASQAKDYEMRTRSQVEGARADLISQAVSTTDPQNAANRALSAATANASGPGYTPLGALFGAASPIVANNMMLNASNPNNQMFNYPGQQSSKGSGKVIK
jgi:hypothetical protein